jgi:hypothetical protein
LSIASCGPSREEITWILAAGVFILFVVGIIAIHCVHWLHGNPKFLSFVDGITTPIIITGTIILCVGLVVFIWGLFYLFEEETHQHKALPLLGVTIAVCGMAIRLWAKANSTSRKRLYAKIATFSFGIILALTFLLIGPSEIEFN